MLDFGRHAQDELTPLELAHVLFRLQSSDSWILFSESCQSMALQILKEALAAQGAALLLGIPRKGPPMSTIPHPPVSLVAGQQGKL